MFGLDNPNRCSSKAKVHHPTTPSLHRTPPFSLALFLFLAAKMDAPHNGSDEASDAGQTEDKDQEIAPPCDHAACRITTYSDDERALDRMTVADRLTIVRGILCATKAAFYVNKLFENKSHKLNLLKRRKRHEDGQNKDEYKS